MKKFIVDESFKGIEVDTFFEKKIFDENENIFYYIVDNEYGIVRKFVGKFEVDFYLLEIEKSQLLQKIDFEGEIVLFFDSGDIISNTDNTLFRYTNFSLLWQKDFSEITNYKDYDGSLKQGEIREIYSYNNTLIVLTQLFILRINLQTGEIIYSLQLPAGLMTLSIEGDKAYGCYGYHYMEIDLEKGELINFVRIENALLNGQEYNAIMNKACYKDGFVFHGLRLEGGQYAVGAINTKTGKREWISPLSVSMVEKIEFHNDKMFILDTGGNLYIYEKN
ncbi:hypothetical protein [Capnocytophaga felis]|nr:hypothetical protein [Capnocytophaga felis]